jgi:hypothetical protein
MNSAFVLIPLLILAYKFSPGASRGYGDPKGNGKVCHLKQMFSQTIVSTDPNGHKKKYKFFLSKKPIGQGAYGKVRETFFLNNRF